MNRTHLHLAGLFAGVSLGAVVVGIEGAQWWLTGHLDTVGALLLAIGLLAVIGAVLQCFRALRPDQPDDLMDLADILDVRKTDLDVLAAYEHEVADLDRLARRLAAGGPR